MGWGRVAHPGGGRIHVHRFENGCVNRDCPRHYKRWAARQAASTVNRLEGQRFIQRVVVSYDIGLDDISTEKELDDLYHFTYSCLRLLGCKGGVAIFHAQRIPSRFNERDDISEGPHFHCIVDTKIDPEIVVGLHEQFGTVIKGMGRPGNLIAHLEYVLSHLGLPRERIPGSTETLDPVLNPALDGIIACRMHTIRWFGTWTRLKSHKETGRFCPICGHQVDLSDWGRPIWVPIDRPPPDDEWIDGSETDWVIKNGNIGEWE